MSLYYAGSVLGGEGPALDLELALEALDPAPVATERHDRDDGSGVWEVGAYFGAAPDAAGLALLARLHGAADFAVRRVEARDWAAQVRAELTPVEAGRFVVFGSHDRDRVPAHRIGLMIEAAQAFGTGHHATTEGCLRAIDALARGRWRPRRVADIGAGTGVLAMAAVAVWPARAVASDVDPLATATARENAAVNRLGPRILTLTARGFEHPLLRGRYDLVLANILAGPLKRLAPAMAGHAAPGAVLVLSGVLSRQAAGVEAVYRAWGFRRRRLIRIGDWTTLVLSRGR